MSSIPFLLVVVFYISAKAAEGLLCSPLQRNLDPASGTVVMASALS